LDGAIDSIVEGMRLINNSIPELLKDISVAEKLPSRKEKKLELVRFRGVGSGVEVVLNSKDKPKFLKN